MAIRKTAKPQLKQGTNTQNAQGSAKSVNIGWYYLTYSIMHPKALRAHDHLVVVYKNKKKSSPVPIKT